MCPEWSSRLLSAVLAAVVLLGIAVARLALKLSDVHTSNLRLQTDFKDALAAISSRADKESAIAKQALDSLAAFERAVGDKRAIEASLNAEREGSTFLRDRVTELQRALMAFQDRAVAAQVIRASSPEKEEAVPERPSRWVAAAGTYRPSRPLADIMRETQTAQAFTLVPDPTESM